MDKEQRETIQMIKDKLQHIFDCGGTRCKLCGEWIVGDDPNHPMEVIRALGEHGEKVHGL